MPYWVKRNWVNLNINLNKKKAVGADLSADVPWKESTMVY
jgi:hypothetical protein